MPPTNSQIRNPRILPLPEDAVAHVCSSKQITSLQGVVLALVANSLDAGAKKIDISIDQRLGNCTVEDNGQGIEAADFDQHGGLCKPFHTSKYNMPTGHEMHGNTGTFLASMSSLSLLTLYSRRVNEPAESRLTIHQGRVLHRSTGQTSTRNIENSGTIVQVKDLFGNMPVRVKQRALNANQRGDIDRVWLDLKYGLCALLLFWRSPCTITIRDASNGTRERKKIRLATTQAEISAPLTERGIRKLNDCRAKPGIKDFIPVLCQADLCLPTCLSDWVSVSASAGAISVSGAICLQPAPSTSCQFLSFGVNPCNPADGGFELFNAINAVFANSSFGYMGEILNRNKGTRVSSRSRDVAGNLQNGSRKQPLPRKSVDRWPMFVLTLKFDNAHEHSNFEHLADGQLKCVTDLLEATCTQWLVAHNFRTRKPAANLRPSSYGDLRDSMISMKSNSSTLATEPCGSGLANSYLKRSASSVTSGSIEKRRRQSSYSGDHKLHSNLGHLETGHQGDISSLSGVKCSDHRLFDRLLLQRPCSNATELQSVRPLSYTARSNCGMSPEQSEVPQANSTAPQATPNERRRSPSLQIEQSYRQHECHSSDDYGSIDDEKMIAAADTVCSNHGNDVTSHAALNPQVKQEATNLTRWVDPVTRQVHYIDTRTGVICRNQSVPCGGNSSSTSKPRSVQSTLRTPAKRRSETPISLLRSLPSRGAGEQQREGWLPSFLQSWQNPVYRQQDEDPIPHIGLPLLHDDLGKGHISTKPLFRNQDNEDGVKQKLTKTALAAAKVFGQVDRKFIMCVMPTVDDSGMNSQQSLVLVDQHAASERVILESLLSELCTPISVNSSLADFKSNIGYSSAIDTVMMGRGLQVQLTRRECQVLKHYGSHFAQWGILYDLGGVVIGEDESLSGHQQNDHHVVIRTLPPGIAERCRLFPQLLVDVLRTELWALANAPSRMQGSGYMSDENGERIGSGSSETHRWLSVIGSCPKGIIEMLNSRACRSAIMFNDVLKMADCRELIDQLRACAFPFMCAHGRISMVPLVGLEDGLGRGNRSPHQDRHGSFAAKFQDWQQGGELAST